MAQLHFSTFICPIGTAIHFTAHITREFNRQLSTVGGGRNRKTSVKLRRAVVSISISFSWYLTTAYLYYSRQIKQQQRQQQQQQQQQQKNGLFNVSYKDSALHENLIIRHFIDTEKRGTASTTSTTLFKFYRKLLFQVNLHIRTRSKLFHVQSQHWR